MDTNIASSWGVKQGPVTSHSIGPMPNSRGLSAPSPLVGIYQILLLPNTPDIVFGFPLSSVRLLTALLSFPVEMSVTIHTFP